MRFEREAKTISQLNHPHLCTLYDVGDGYVVTEVLEGETLARIALNFRPPVAASCLVTMASMTFRLARVSRGFGTFAPSGL